MELSDYIITTTTDDGLYLLFSSLSTAFIALTKEEYDKIVVKKDFTNCENLDFLKESLNYVNKIPINF